MNKSEAYDAAMLAGLVSSNLNHVEKHMINSSRPVNKINMNQFVAPLMGQQAGNSPQYGEGATPAMLKAMEDSLRQAMQIPEPTNTNGTPAFIPPPVVTQPPSIPFVQPPQEQQKQAAASSGSISNEDIQIIKSQLEKINANLTKMTGMFGKVFASLTTQNISVKNGK